MNASVPFVLGGKLNISSFDVVLHHFGISKHKQSEILEDKMKNEDTYTSQKVRNQFTAYLLSQVKGKRRDYFKKLIQISHEEEPTDDFSLLKLESTVEEDVANKRKEELLLKEADGIYPKWNEMTDRRLMDALGTLREDERRLIYQHVFEELTFDEMSQQNGMPCQRIKSVYYYAIQKIRKLMGGDKREF